ncbi:MAG: hypothetical protein K6F37_09740 [Lachnospiraceae bacterium]|nr:hypothetical protein [Lachnospiraceae bacterium]
MKQMRKFVVFILAVTLVFAAMPIAQVQAASKKNVYVITKVKVKQDGESTTTKLAYNKTGLLKTITDPREDLTETFKYNSKGQLTEYKETIKSGDHKGNNTTRKYTWKNGLLTIITWSGSDGSKDKYELKYKNKKLNKVLVTSTWTNDNGKKETDTRDKKITLNKKGHISKIEEANITEMGTFDKNGNVTKWSAVYDGNEVGYVKTTYTYKNGRVIKLKRESYNPMMNNPLKETWTITYSKKSVDKKYVSYIAEQQWKFLNGNVENYAW